MRTVKASPRRCTFPRLEPRRGLHGHGSKSLQLPTPQHAHVFAAHQARTIYPYPPPPVCAQMRRRFCPCPPATGIILTGSQWAKTRTGLSSPSGRGAGLLSVSQLRTSSATACGPMAVYLPSGQCQQPSIIPVFSRERALSGVEIDDTLLSLSACSQTRGAPMLSLRLGRGCYLPGAKQGHP